MDSKVNKECQQKIILCRFFLINYKWYKKDKIVWPSNKQNKVKFWPFCFLLLGFAQSYLLSDDFYIVGALFSGMSESDVNTFDQKSPSDKTCYIYRSRSNQKAFLCMCKTDVSNEQSYSWTEQVSTIKIHYCVMKMVDVIKIWYFLSSLHEACPMFS